ncbi:MAG TPA: DUF1569 domain-containing protein [Holophagaceae bacterium]|nr:DUF1569 domain-containing protein [Holophagaceae bacterium]
MKHLYDPAVVAEVKGRVARLQPESARQWGRMTPAQAMAHCAAGLETATGELSLPRVWFGRIFGRLAKRMALSDDAPFGRNSPTAREFRIEGTRDLPQEQARVQGLIDRFTAAGPAGCTTHPHAFFGPLTPEEWAVLMYKHLDHHLRQFGA